MSTSPHPQPLRELAPLLLISGGGLILIFLGGAAELVILSALLAYVLDPLTTRIESRGVGRALATTIVLVGIIAVIVGVAVILVPTIKDQVQSLQSGETSEQAKASLLQVELLLEEKLAPLGVGDLALVDRTSEFKQTLGHKAFEFLVSDFLSLVIHGVTIPFMMFFFLKDGREMKKAFVRLVPNRYFEFTMDLLFKMDTQLGNYMRSQFLDAIAFGVLATIGLWVLGVPYFFFIGAFAGAANIIPYVGPLAGVLPGVVVATLDTGDIMAGIWVIIVFVLMKLIDDFVIQPIIVARGVELHPLMVLVVIMVGGGLFGILGMLIAVPIAGFLKVVFREGIATYRKYRFY